MNPIERTKELLNIINNMEFKGNPIRAGKLSKKYLEYIKKFPITARIPSRILDQRSKTPKLKKQYSKLGFIIKENKLVQEIEEEFNEIFGVSNYSIKKNIPAFLTDKGRDEVVENINKLVNIALKKNIKESPVLLTLLGKKIMVNNKTEPFRLTLGALKMKNTKNPELIKKLESIQNKTEEQKAQLAQLKMVGMAKPLEQEKLKDVSKDFFNYYNNWIENNVISGSLTDVKIEEIRIEVIKTNNEGGALLSKANYKSIKLNGIKIIDYNSKGVNNCFFWCVKDWIKEKYQVQRVTPKLCNDIREKYRLEKDSMISDFDVVRICRKEFEKDILVINAIDYDIDENVEFDRKLFLMDKHYYLYEGKYGCTTCPECGTQYYKKHNKQNCKKIQSFQNKSRLVLPNKKLKPKKHFNKNKLVLHYDIESHTKNKNHEHLAYIVGFVYFCKDKEEWVYKEFTGRKCMEEFYDYIRYIPDIKYLNAYNGNRFDHYFLSKIAILKDTKNEKSKVLISNGSILQLTIPKFNNLGTLQTIDLNRHLTGSLDKNLKSNGCSVAKGSIDHTLSTYWEETEEERKQKVREYLYCDVMGLKELYEKFNNSLYEEEQLNLCDFMTGSQKSYDIWRTNRLGGHIVELPIKEEDDFYRESVYGGRCYPNKKFFKSKEYEKIMKGEINFEDIEDYLIAVDFVSLYPSAMLEEYPIGFHINTNEYVEGKLGIYRVKFITNKKCLVPPIPRKKEGGGLIWDLLDGEGVYTSVDIERAKRHGYKFEIIEGKYWEESAPIFEDYMTHYYKKKQAEKKGTPAYETAKLNLNGLYGKMMQRPIYEDKTEVRNSDQLNEILVCNVITDIFKVNKSLWIVSSEPKEEEDYDKKINKPSHEGAFVLAYSRELMWKVYEDLGSIYDMEKLFYYGDTDSLHTHQKYTKNLKFKNDLGGVQNDLGEGAKIICGMWVQPKLYMEEYITKDMKIHRHYRGAGVPQEQLDKTCYKRMLKGLSQSFKPKFQIKKNCLESKVSRYEDGIVKQGESKIFSLYHITDTEVNEDGEFCLEKVLNTKPWTGRNFESENVSYPWGYEK